jgi:hypothetical protein
MTEINSTVNRARAAGAVNVGFPWRLLIISFVVFGLTVLLWAGIKFGYIPFLNSQLDKVTSSFNSLSQKVSADQQKSLTDFYSQLYNIQTLQNNHKYPARLFDFLERNIYSGLNITNFEANLDGGDIRFDGVAFDFQTLVNQLSLLRMDPNVSLVTLESSRQRDLKEGGGVSFSIKMSIKPNYFNKSD